MSSCSWRRVTSQDATSVVFKKGIENAEIWVRIAPHRQKISEVAAQHDAHDLALRLAAQAIQSLIRLPAQSLLRASLPGAQRGHSHGSRSWAQHFPPHVPFFATVRASVSGDLMSKVSVPGFYRRLHTTHMSQATKIPFESPLMRPNSELNLSSARPANAVAKPFQSQQLKVKGHVWAGCSRRWTAKPEISQYALASPGEYHRELISMNYRLPRGPIQCMQQLVTEHRRERLEASMSSDVAPIARNSSSNIRLLFYLVD
ncbi:hypothetical protein AB1N83_012322 [Pleurotus pulmonarius]